MAVSEIESLLRQDGNGHIVAAMLRARFLDENGQQIDADTALLSRHSGFEALNGDRVGRNA